jgi:galactose-1-phosphate uridylyltransferase
MVFPEGRLARGRCVLFPNLNPYEVNSPVVAIGDRPYVEADQLDSQDVTDAFCLMREFFARLPARVAASGVVGWNFLPAAGSSIPHPHIQALASGRTPDRQKRERRGELRYQHRAGTPFWTDLIAAEKKGPRWLGARRNWSAMVAFAPRSVVPETWLVHRAATSLLDASNAALGGLAEWVVRLAAAHHAEGVYAFNLILNPTAAQRGLPSRLRARFLPRVYVVEPIHSSDWVWVNLGTEEGLTSITPETWARTVRDRLD